MGTNDKFFKINIDYQMADEDRSDNNGGLIPYHAVTRNLINVAYANNYSEGMDANASRIWREVRDVLEDACSGDTVQDHLVLPSTTFDSIYTEVYAAKFHPRQAVSLPFLLDELDVAKNRSQSDNVDLIRDLQNVTTQVINGENHGSVMQVEEIAKS